MARATTRRVGRPPRVTAAQIAEAALAVGLEQATIRTVADHLGMSVPGLYHHVRSREELLTLAAAHQLEALPFPADRGQPWAAWLAEYARFVFDALVVQPEVVVQLLAGRADAVRLVQHLERVFEVLTSRGFTVAEADAAYELVTSAAVGAAVTAIGIRAKATVGHRQDELRAAVKALGAEEVPLVDRLVRGRRRRPPDPFDAVVLTIAGLAAQRRPS